MQVLKGKQPGPRRILLYGKHGVGKSTFAASSPNAIFLDIEDGLGDLDVSKSPKLESFDALMNSLVWLDQAEHEYRTVVVDTVDWVEQLIHKKVCEEASVTSIGEIPYGKGPDKCTPRWQMFIHWLDQLRAKRRMGVVLLSHAQSIKTRNPGEESYDCWGPAIHATASELLQEWADEVLYARTRVFTQKEDLGFKKTRAIAVGGEERYLQCVASASAAAKNRLNLPAELPLDWASYAQYLSRPTPAAGDIAGMVVNGSSKVPAPAA